MELNEVMMKRRSIRKFKDQKVSDEDIKTLLHYAMSGPSAHNKKPWEFYVVRNTDKLEALKTASPYTNYNAPLAIIVAGNLDNALSSNKQDYWIQDCSAAIENILLGVTSLELGACWCGLFPVEENISSVQSILNIEKNILPLGLLYIGYPDVESTPRDQYEEEKVHYVD